MRIRDGKRFKNREKLGKKCPKNWKIVKFSFFLVHDAKKQKIADATFNNNKSNTHTKQPPAFLPLSFFHTLIDIGSAAAFVIVVSFAAVAATNNGEKSYINLQKFNRQKKNLLLSTAASFFPPSLLLPFNLIVCLTSRKQKSFMCPHWTLLFSIFMCGLSFFAATQMLNIWLGLWEEKIDLYRDQTIDKKS